MVVGCGAGETSDSSSTSVRYRGDRKWCGRSPAGPMYRSFQSFSRVPEMRVERRQDIHDKTDASLVV